MLYDRTKTRLFMLYDRTKTSFYQNIKHPSETYTMIVR